MADPDLWDRVVEAAGTIDVAYLNAGVYGFTGRIDELPLDVYRRTIDANIDGVVLGTRAVVPVMRAAGGGSIVVTASVAGMALELATTQGTGRCRAVRERGEPVDWQFPDWRDLARA